MFVLKGGAVKYVYRESFEFTDATSFFTSESQHVHGFSILCVIGNMKQVSSVDSSGSSRGDATMNSV
jgi:hypothetical protein